MGVDFEMKDQVWLGLSLMSNDLLGFVYIPPLLSRITLIPIVSVTFPPKKLCRKEEGCDMLLMGDLNARFGFSVQNILFTSETPRSHELS